MPQTSSEREAAQASFRDAARALFISGDTIAAFLASATPGQIAACTSMLESEIAHRDGTRRARLLRQARFPVPKSVEGFDWCVLSTRREQNGHQFLSRLLTPPGHDF